MTVEQQHCEDTERPELAVTITAEEFAAVGAEVACPSAKPRSHPRPQVCPSSVDTHGFTRPDGGLVVNETSRITRS